MKLIDDWKQAWKLKSVQVGAASAFFLCPDFTVGAVFKCLECHSSGAEKQDS